MTTILMKGKRKILLVFNYSSTNS